MGQVTYDPSQERESITFEEQVRTMSDLIRKGKIRHWGLSNESSYGTVMTCVTADRLNCPRPIAIQNSFSLVNREFEGELVEVCCERHFHLPLVPWSAAAMGLLSGKYLNGQMPKGTRMDRWGYRYPRYHTQKVTRAIEAYAKIAEEFGWSPIQLAYLFCKSRFFIPSTLIGVSNVDQLDENLSCFGEELSKEALQAIDAVHAAHPNPQNTF